MAADDPTAFPELTDDQLDRVRRFGTERGTAVGQLLFKPGDESYDFFVMLEGRVEIRVETGGDETVVASHGPRRFLGELSMLTDQRVYLAAVVVEPGRVLVVPRSELRRLFAAEPDLSDLILRAFILRRQILQGGEGARSLQLIGSRFSPRTIALGLPGACGRPPPLDRPGGRRRRRRRAVGVRRLSRGDSRRAHAHGGAAQPGAG